MSLVHDALSRAIMLSGEHQILHNTPENDRESSLVGVQSANATIDALSLSRALIHSVHRKVTDFYGVCDSLSGVLRIDFCGVRRGSDTTLTGVERNISSSSSSISIVQRSGNSISSSLPHSSGMPLYY